MFAGRPDLVTAGRYVRMPPGTPLYNGPHNLWSRSWVSDFMDEDPALGQMTGPTTWDNGANGGALPLTITVGKRACIGYGLGGQGSDSVPLIDGYRAGCWPADIANGLNFGNVLFDPNSKQFRVFCALVLEYMYSNPVVAQLIVELFMAPPATVTLEENNASFYPGSLIAVAPRYTVVWISGTTNDIQRAMQCMNAAVGIQAFAQYRTLAFWQSAANVIGLRILDAGSDPSKPIVLIGHSYGGVIASLLAASMKWVQSTRDIRLLTFGAPRPGDQLLAGLLSTVNSCHLANDGDPIPNFPPGLTDMLTFLGFISDALADRISTFAPPPGRAVLFADGRIVPGNGTTITSAVFYAMMLLALTNGPYPAFAAHEMGEYYNRLLLSAG